MSKPPPAAPFGAVDPPVPFPEVSAQDLNGRLHGIPGELGGSANVVVLGYERYHQRLIDTWLQPLAAMAERWPDLRYWEMPVAGRVGPVGRWIIDNGMRAGIADLAQRARTITLYVDRAPFRHALDIPGEDTIQTLLLDGRGRVVWRADGAATPPSLAALEEAIAAALSERGALRS